MIKPFREVLVWPLPLVLVMMEGGHIEEEGVTFSDIESTCRDVL